MNEAAYSSISMSQSFQVIIICVITDLEWVPEKVPDTLIEQRLFLDEEPLIMEVQTQ